MDDSVLLISVFDVFVLVMMWGGGGVYEDEECKTNSSYRILSKVDTSVSHKEIQRQTVTEIVDSSYKKWDK